MLAASNGHVSCVMVLLRNGASINAHNSVIILRNVFHHFDATTGHMAFLQVRNTPLILAVEKGHQNVVELITSKGAAMDIANQVSP